MTNELLTDRTSNPNAKEDSLYKRINGFDYLRAFGCIFVVAFHTLGRDTFIQKGMATLVFGSAVPCFVLISLFLTQTKGFKRDYVIKKTSEIFYIYFIWGWILPLIIGVFFGGLNNFKDINQFDLNDIYIVAMSGIEYFKVTRFNPAGIYFLPLLIILTWLGYFTFRFIASYRALYFWFFLLALINLFLPFAPNFFAGSTNHVGNNILFGEPSTLLGAIPFLIYIPASKIIFMDYIRQRKMLVKSAIFGAAYLVVAVFEGSSELLEDNFVLSFFHSPYARLSVVLLALSVTYASLCVKQKLGSNNILGMISRYSLGIYLTHGFVINSLNFSLDITRGFPLFIITFSLSMLITSIIVSISPINRILKI